VVPAEVDVHKKIKAYAPVFCALCHITCQLAAFAHFGSSAAAYVVPYNG
jgi:hypothetical protein